MYKKTMFLVILPILAVLLACNIPKTNAYNSVFEELNSQPYVSFSTPYNLSYMYVSTSDSLYRSTTFDSSNTFVVDSNGNVFENWLTTNDGDVLFYNATFDADGGYFGDIRTIGKEFQVITLSNTDSTGFVGHLDGVISTTDFLNFLQCYSIEHFTENLIDIDFSSILNVTMSIPIDNDSNNTLTTTLNYSDDYSSPTDNYHRYNLYERYVDVFSDLSTLFNDYSIDYVYFDLTILFDIVYFEYSEGSIDSLYFKEYVVIGDNYEPSVEAYRSVFGGYVVEEVINPDFSSWLVTGIGSFMNLEIIPGWSIAVILSVMIGIPLLIYVLRLFFGG